MLSRTSDRSHTWLTTVGVVAVALMAAALTSPVARAQQFSTATGSSVGDGPVDATAIFTTGPGTVTITLQDLLANPTSVGQTVNGVNFKLSDGDTAGSITSQTGEQITITGTGPGQFTTSGSPSSPVTGSSMWMYYGGMNSNGGSTPGVVEVTSLGNMAAIPTIIGNPDSSNAYSNGNGSITGNHNPFLFTDGTSSSSTVTIVLSIASVMSGDTVTGMNFQFGTGEGEGVVPGTPGPPQPPGTVPEPSTLAIAGLGALGFIGFGLRRRLKK